MTSPESPPAVVVYIIMLFSEKHNLNVYNTLWLCLALIIFSLPFAFWTSGFGLVVQDSSPHNVTYIHVPWIKDDLISLYESNERILRILKDSLRKHSVYINNTL